jgi:hypothetical protein
MEQIDRLTGASASMTELAALVESSITRAFNDLLPQDRRTPDAEIDKLVREHTQKTGQMLHGAVLLNFFLTYRHAADEELQQHAGLLGSASMQWWTTRENHAVVQALAGSFAGFGQRAVAIALAAQSQQ